MFIKPTTSHTLGWPATPGSISEAGIQVVSTQNVGLLAEKLNGLCTTSCVRSRSVVTIKQFGWRGTPDSACLAYMRICLREKRNTPPPHPPINALHGLQTAKMRSRSHLVKMYLSHMWVLYHSMCH